MRQTPGRTIAHRPDFGWLLVGLLLLAAVPAARAGSTDSQPGPAPTPKLPACPNDFGEDGHFYAGVRQSRLGVKGCYTVGDAQYSNQWELSGGITLRF